jgi:hypothetical protein
MAKASPEDMARTMIENLPEKTGKSLAEWLKILGQAKLEKHGEMVKLLKSEHGVTHGFANLIAHEYRSRAAGAGSSSQDPLAAQYQGPKAALRPIYDAIAKQVGKFGSDVEFAPKKAYVSLRRSKQFGLVQPSTKDRVDVGLNLKGVEPAGRLEASGSFNAMVTHRVRLASVKDVDRELIGWLRQAYDAA